MPEEQGLMTVNMLIRALLADFLTNKKYIILRQMKNKKSEIDALIKENEVNAQHFYELKNGIIESETGTILKEVEQQIPKIARISAILKKAKERSKTSEELKSQIDFINYLFDFIVTAMAGAGKRNLAWLDAQQKKALVENNYEEFTALFAEENRLCSKFDRLAENLNLAGIAETFKKPLDKKSKWFKRVLLAGITIVLLGTAGLYSAAFMKIYARDKDIFEQAVKMYMAEDLLHETEEEQALEKIYGFNIIGDYTQNDLSRLKEIMNRRKAEEIKNYGIKTIVIMGGEHKGKVPYNARIYLARGELRLFSKDVHNTQNIEHELAHARQYWLFKSKPDFDEKWALIAGEYNKVSEVAATAELKEYRYKAQFQTEGMLHGYANVYGGTDIYEDVASFVEVIRGDNIRLFSTITADFDIYRSKIKLLKNYGFIDGKEAKMALAQIDIAQHQNVGIIGELGLGPAGTPENDQKIISAAFDMFQKQDQNFFRTIDLLEAKGYIRDRFKGAIRYITGMMHYYYKTMQFSKEEMEHIKKDQSFAEEFRKEAAKEAFRAAANSAHNAKDEELAAKAKAFIDHINGKTQKPPADYPATISKAIAKKYKQF